MNKQTGLLEAPPAMIRDIGEWVQAQVAANRMAELAEELEALSDYRESRLPRYKDLQEAIDNLKKILPTGGPRELSNATKEFLGQGMIWGYWLPQWKGAEFQKLTPEKRDILVGRISTAIRDAENRIEQETNPDSSIKTIHKKMAELKPYLRPGVKAMTGPTLDQEIPVDLTGWKYGDKELIEAMIQNKTKKIKEILQELKGNPKAKEVIKIYKDSLKGVIKNMAGWKTILVSLQLETGTPTAGGSWQYTLRQLKIVLPKNAAPWMIEGPLMEVLRHELQHMAQTILREALTNTEDWFNAAHVRLPGPGMPSRHIMTPYYKQEDRGLMSPEIRQKLREKSLPVDLDLHSLDDVEFYTNLEDSITEAKTLLRIVNDNYQVYKKVMSEAEIRSFIAWIVGAHDNKNLFWGGAKERLPLFLTWKKHAPGKWRKGVKEMVKKIPEIIDSLKAKKVANRWIANH